MDLFERGKNVVSLTSVGKIFLREAREVLAHMEQAVQTTLRAANGRAWETFRWTLWAGSHQAAARNDPGISRAQSRDHLDHQRPGARASAGGARRRESSTSVSPGASHPEYDHLLGSEVFFQEPLMAALPAGHPLATKRMVQPSQLAKEPFILYHREGAPELFDAVIALCRRAKFAPHIGASPNRWQSVLTLVEAGEGVSLVPASVRHLRSNGVVFRALGGRRSFRRCRARLAQGQSRPDPRPLPEETPAKSSQGRCADVSTL